MKFTRACGREMFKSAACRVTELTLYVILSRPSVVFVALEDEVVAFAAVVAFAVALVAFASDPLTPTMAGAVAKATCPTARPMLGAHVHWLLLPAL